MRTRALGINRAVRKWWDCNEIWAEVGESAREEMFAGWQSRWCEETAQHDDEAPHRPQYRDTQVTYLVSQQYW